MNDDVTERWLPVPGYQGLYEVSSLGRVRSLDRLERITGVRGGIRLRHGRQLRQFPMDTSPYLFVRLSINGRAKTVTVHSVVVKTFATRRPGDVETRHLNGNPRDNRATNLAWGTKSENTIDQVVHGTHHNSRKTKCPRGHDYDYIVPRTGNRQCGQCRTILAERRKKARAARRRPEDSRGEMFQ